MHNVKKTVRVFGVAYNLTIYRDASACRANAVLLLLFHAETRDGLSCDICPEDVMRYIAHAVTCAYTTVEHTPNATMSCARNSDVHAGVHDTRAYHHAISKGRTNRLSVHEMRNSIQFLLLFFTVVVISSLRSVS